MSEQVSIWRWQVSEGLEALFARLIAAPDETFSVIAGEMMQHGMPEAEDPETIYAQTEAKIRAMGLPPAELATTLAGLRAMWEEDMAEMAAWEEDDAADGGPDPEGRIDVALASSHMFFDDPYASLSYEEIERQVRAALALYRAAISQTVGQEGQAFAAYLGLDTERLYEDAAFDVLMEAGLAEVEWIWETAEHVLFLSQSHEDKELPIDLEFGRAPPAVFDALRARIDTSHEM